MVTLSQPFKNTYYTLSHLFLFTLGLVFMGISIFLLSRKVDTVSQAFFLTSVWYVGSSILGGIAHRASHSGLYKAQAINLAILAGSQLFVVLSLGFAWKEVIAYLRLLDGGERYEVSETISFFEKFRPAALTIFSLTIINYSFTAFVASMLHYDTYKAFIASEFERLFDLGHSSEKKHGPMEEEYNQILAQQDLYFNKHQQENASTALISPA